MRFHVVALPHTQTTREYIACAYTAKVRGFCRMMMERGHEVILYAGEENDVRVTEHVIVATEKERRIHVGEGHFVEAKFSGALWDVANGRTIKAIKERNSQKDFICLIGGWAQKPIADALPAMMTVEFGVGYGGVFSKYKVFESYAWMHTVYGARTNGNAHAADGNWWDAVIPGYLDPEEFPPSDEQEDYLLYVGRVIERKGWGIAREVAEATGRRLVVAGQGDPGPGVDYRGVVGPEERAKLMSRARAVMVPTIYVEPFANVHVEAMTCGTPVVTTDWGVFTETVEEGVTGFRCRTFKEFKLASERASELDRGVIRKKAIERFSLEVVGEKYERYFERLASLWEKGWYQE